jgi:acetyltransferase-like isoleucine patch superfamily enzyme
MAIKESLSTLNSIIHHDNAVLTIGKRCIIHNNVHFYGEVYIGDDVEIFPGCVIGRYPTSAGATAREVCKNFGVVNIGNGSVLCSNATLYKDVSIGNNVLIGDNASIREDCRIGDKTIISRNVTINYNSSIGSRTKIMDNSHITGNMIVEDDVFISVGIITSNDKTIGSFGYNSSVIGPTLKSGCKIGAGANLLPGVVIGKNSIVTASSLVKGDIDDNKVVSGSPAKELAISPDKLLVIMNKMNRIL